jgi:1-aminocyclopropane-1-carboxylate deaminase/D-cysteine desulfhydrase-like pyridoxal-dependent ACC family enzyme
MDFLKSPRLKCATLPTPLHKLEALSGRLCTEVFVKRDDLTGSAMGGNKIRNAEFLLGDALQQQADVILTIGALQSNHALAIAPGSRRLGKECHLFLSGELKGEPSANLLLNQLAGAHIHMVSSPSDRHTAMMKYAADLSAKGQKPYPIPLGGSNDIGTQGYALAFLELQNQLNKLPHKAGLIDLSIRDEFANERLIFLLTGGSTATFSFSPSVFTSGLDAQD